MEKYIHTLLLALIMLLSIINRAEAQIVQFPLNSYMLTTEECDFMGECDMDGLHTAEDAVGAAGTPVYAPADGVVVHTRVRTGYGNVVMVESVINNETVVFLMAHMRSSDLQASVDDPVSKGQWLGSLGNYNENGNWPEHLHFGIHKGAFSDTVSCSGRWTYAGYENAECAYDDWYDPTDFILFHQIPPIALSKIRSKVRHLRDDLGILDHRVNTPHWYNEDPGTKLVLQDWVDHAGQSAAMLYRVPQHAHRQASLVRSGFWQYYITHNGFDVLGGPLGDEQDAIHPDWGTDWYCRSHALSPEDCIHALCGYNCTFTAMQRFEQDTLFWDANEYMVVLGSTLGYDPYAAEAIIREEDMAKLDQDYDGFTPDDGDCNDRADHVYPGYPELFDQTDNDCDGKIDETFDRDYDGYTEDQGDCGPTSDHVYPGALELRDDVDNDCDHLIDEDFDLDGDGYSYLQGDCSEQSNAIHPGALETKNNIDDNCNNVIDEPFDLDGDGYSYMQGDCNEQSNAIYPNALEQPDGLDNNCNGTVDDPPLMYQDSLIWEDVTGPPIIEDFSSVTPAMLGMYLNPNEHFNGFTIRTTQGYLGHTGVELALAGMVCATETDNPASLTAFMLTLDTPSTAIGFEPYSFAAALTVYGYRSGVLVNRFDLAPDPFIGLTFASVVDTVVIEASTPYDGICLESVWW